MTNYNKVLKFFDDPQAAVADYHINNNAENLKSLFTCGRILKQT